MLHDVFIPSAGRCGLIGDIIRSFKDIDCKVHLIVPNEEVASYRSEYKKVTILPQLVGRLPAAQELAIKYAYNMGMKRMILVDDDFRLFYKMIQDGDLIETHDFFTMVEQFSKALDDVPVTGITNRFHHNVKPFPYEEIAPMHTIQAFDVREIVKNKISFARVETYNDTDWLLQCFKLGLRNRVWTNMIRGTKESLTGGCSRYRDTDLFKRAAMRLAELHPGVVKLRGGTRNRCINGKDNEIYKMTVYWKKSFRKGL